MPAPITSPTGWCGGRPNVRKNGTLPWLRPDAKSQVTLRYEDGKPPAVDAVVLSTQHDPDISQADLREAVMDSIIKPVLPTEWLERSTRYHINPTGRFVIGGPVGDCGLTGRKIIVDTYGGMARHGGGAFSGKDPSKVDRSAAYACALRGKEHRRRRSGRALRDPAVLRHRRRRADLDARGDIRHRQGVRRPAGTTGPTALRPHALRHSRDARPGAPDLPRDRRLRPFRPRRAELTWERTDRAEALRVDAAA